MLKIVGYQPETDVGFGASKISNECNVELWVI